MGLLNAALNSWNAFEDARSLQAAGVTFVFSSSLNDMFRDFAQDDWRIGDRHHEFIKRFKQENDRAPRVLNIGNIANNAFKNARILNEIGMICDALCYDYYHVMGCPEWEYCSFSTDGLNFNAPSWGRMGIDSDARPRWFAQGRLLTCIDYLLARRAGSPDAERLWRCLASERDSGGNSFADSSTPAPYDPALVQNESQRLAAMFEAIFPERPLKPSANDIAGQYGSLIAEMDRLQRLFAHYDLVVGYSTDGLLPLIARKTPYVCFEHGTIRTFPFEDTLFGQMCALSYSCAGDVLISNCDNIVAARKLGLRSLRFIPHAMLEDFRTDPQVAALRTELLARHDADFVILHPSRQHWSESEDLNWEKGNDRLIRAFARFVRHTRPKALLIMVAWGQTVEASKRLIADLGIEDRVVWLLPQPVRLLGRYVAAADVLADQFVIGAWGAIMPHGMMLGTPTMLYLNEAVHTWCFPQMPPVLNTRTDDEIHAGLIQAVDPEFRARIREESMSWYDQFHSEAVVAGRLVDSIAAVLRPDPVSSLLRGQREIKTELLLLGHTIMHRQSTSLGSITADLRHRARRALGSPPATRLRSSVRKLQARRPVIGGIIYHALYWPFRAALWAGRALTRLTSK